MPPKPGELNHAEENANQEELNEEQENLNPNEVDLDGEQINNFEQPVPPEDGGEEIVQEAGNEALGEQHAPQENVQPGSYKAFMKALQQEAREGGVRDSVVANMIAATILMQRDANAQKKDNEVHALAAQILSQPSFGMLMKDPKTAALVKQGKGLDLIQQMAVKENERKSELDSYRRPDEYVAEDGLFLRHAIENLKKKSGQAASGAAQKEFQGRHFLEMVKQLEHAESMAEQGIQMSGEDTKKLVDAVKKYNDGGSKIPGGPKKSQAFVDSMCILKRFMPENEFQKYVGDINATHKRQIDPESFTPDLVTGNTTSLQALRTDCRIKLQEKFTVENCAALVAVSMVPIKNGLVSRDDFEQAKQKLMANGSAFRKAMQDPDVKEKVTSIVKNGGKNSQVIREVEKGCMDHAGKTAQWQLNRSKQMLLGGRLNAHLSAEHLANVMALNQFSKTATLTDTLNNKGFAERAEEIEKDPTFRRMADRYNSDPEYRAHINNKLRTDGTGKSLAQEYEKVAALGRKPREAAQQGPVAQ